MLSQQTSPDLKKNKVQYAKPVTPSQYEVQTVQTTHNEMIKMAHASALSFIKEEQKKQTTHTSKLMNPIDKFDMREFMLEYEASETEDKRKIKVIYLLNQNTRLIMQYKDMRREIDNLKTKIKEQETDIETADEEATQYITELDEKDLIIDTLTKSNKDLLKSNTIFERSSAYQTKNIESLYRKLKFTIMLLLLFSISFIYRITYTSTFNL